MRRPSRGFRAESFELEGRWLLAAAPALALAPAPGPAPTLTTSQTVQFESPLGSVGLDPLQVVTQQAGEATVWLSRSDTAGSLQVRVTTAPDMWAPRSGNVVGVNVGAVNQTVTFADGQSRAAVTVPILPGAPNPGEVDVYLKISPIDSPTNDTLQNDPVPLDLRIVASDPTLAPKIVSRVASSQELVLSFNKPMDPVGASNVKNYAVSIVSDDQATLVSLLGSLLGGKRSSLSVKPLRLQSAQYDPVTQSVTLLYKQPHINIGLTTSVAQVQPAKRSVPPRHRWNGAPGITDLQGNPINAGSAPGKVALHLRNVIMATGSL